MLLNFDDRSIIRSWCLLGYAPFSLVLNTLYLLLYSNMLLLLAAGIGICAFMFVHLVRVKEQMGQARILAMLIQVLWIIRFGLFYIKLSDIGAVTPAMFMYDQALLFLDGPLIWLYTRALTEKQNFSGKAWLHFMPFAMVTAYATYQVFAYGDQLTQFFQDTWQAWQAGGSTAGGFGLILIAAIIFFNLFYLLKSVGLARAYNRALEAEYSTTDRLAVDWIIQFQRLWVLLFIIPLVLYFLNYIWPVFHMLTLAGLAGAAIVLLTVLFNVNLLKQVYVVLPETKRAKASSRKANTIDGHKEALGALLSVLQKEKAYLNDGLTLSELAASMKIKPAELTELIKASAYDNFYDLINSHRIEEVKAQLLRTDEQVIQLAYQSGFKSKSTFNKIFKEKTGLTPKAYRSAHQ